eukprot:131963-Amphidinium_carterae.1
MSNRGGTDVGVHQCSTIFVPLYFLILWLIGAWDGERLKPSKASKNKDIEHKTAKKQDQSQALIIKKEDGIHTVVAKRSHNKSSKIQPPTSVLAQPNESPWHKNFRTG